jgi:hypothetical protein
MILAAVGCQRPRDVFKAQRPWEKRITVDSAAGRPDGQALPVVAERPDSLKYGFKIIYQGRGEIHLYDEQDRHTGPATAGEYLPTVEALLKQPGLHDQERSNLENVKAKIIRTGSAAEFATTRQIPNLHYQKDAGGLRAEYKGAGELTLQVKPGEAGGESLSLQLWNDRVLRTARYDLPADNGVGQLSLSALMEDFSLSWDSNGDGRDDRDLEPSRLDSTVMAD